MKRFVILIFLFGAFVSVSIGQDDIQLPEIKDNIILEHPEIYIPVTLTRVSNTTVYALNGKTITLPALEAESFDYIKNSQAIQKNYQKQYEDEFEIRGKVNYLITADKAVPFFDIQLLLYYIKSFPDGKVMFQTASEDGKVHAVRVYPPVLLDETQEHIKKEHGLEIERFSMTLYDAFEEPFQLKNAKLFDTNDEPIEVEVPSTAPPPPPPPPPPADIKFIFGDRELSAPPLILYLTEDGVHKFNNETIAPDQFDTILTNVLEEIENGFRAKSSFINENADGDGADIFIVLAVEEGVSAEKTVETYTAISKIVSDKKMKKFVHYSYPKEADLISKAVFKN